MRNAIALCLLLSLGVTAASLEMSVVDLDKPGAMEALALSHPAHYQKVMEGIEKAQAIHVEPTPAVRDARMDDRSREATTILTTDPAKKRISVRVDLVEYRVTAHMTKDPATLQKAR